jgi:hypothetical protein
LVLEEEKTPTLTFLVLLRVSRRRPLPGGAPNRQQNGCAVSFQPISPDDMTKERCRNNHKDDILRPINRCRLSFCHMPTAVVSSRSPPRESKESGPFFFLFYLNKTDNRHWKIQQKMFKKKQLHEPSSSSGY